MLLDSQGLDGDVGVAVALGDVGDVIVGKCNGIADAHALGALQIGVGDLNGLTGDFIALTIDVGTVVVAVALGDGDADGAAVDVFHGAGQLGRIHVEFRQGGGIVGVQNIAAAQGGCRHHQAERQGKNSFFHGVHLTEKILLYIIASPGRKSKEKVEMRDGAKIDFLLIFAYNTIDILWDTMAGNIYGKKKPAAIR